MLKNHMFLWYLLIINLFAFIYYSIDYHLYIRYHKKIPFEGIENFATTFGGALGTLIAYVIWDRKINKINMMSRIYTIFWLVIQTMIVLAIYGPNNNSVRKWGYFFYSDHKILCWYIILINAITFIIFALDKIKAMTGKWRIRELILIGLTLIGGSIGGFLAMDLFNHKVNSPHFAVGVPIILILHFFLLLCVVIGIL